MWTSSESLGFLAVHLTFFFFNLFSNFQSNSFKISSLSSIQHLFPQIYSQLMTCFIFYWQSWSHRREFPHTPTPTCTNLSGSVHIFLPSLFLTVDELSVLLYKANDSSCVLNPVPSLLLNDIASAVSSYLCFTMKLSVLHIPVSVQSLFLCNVKLLAKIIITHCLLSLCSELYSFKLLSALLQSNSCQSHGWPSHCYSKWPILSSHWTQLLSSFWNSFFRKHLFYLAVGTLFSFNSLAISLPDPS